MTLVRKCPETADHAGKVIGEKTEAAKEKMGESRIKCRLRWERSRIRKDGDCWCCAAAAVVQWWYLVCILIPKMFGTDYKESARVAGN